MSSQSKQSLPDTRLSRLAIGSKTAAKVAGKHAIHKAKGLVTAKHKKKAMNDEHAKDVASEIFKALSMLRGTALKAAQIASVDFQFLPEAFRNELKKACYQVPPLNKAVVRKVVYNEMSAYPEALFESFDLEAFAAASIGQVHHATTKKGKGVAVKIQYPGIDKTIENDMALLKTILLRSPVPELKKRTKLLTTFLNECAERFKEEADYTNEIKNLELFAEHNPFDQLKIPVPVPELSSQHMLTMTYLKGDHIDEWLAKGPTQEEKNDMGQLLWDSFAYFFIKHRMLHADPNPGNYLFMENRAIGLLDFGCIKRCDAQFPDQLASVIEYYIKDDIDPILDIYDEWGIIPKASVDSQERLKQHLSFFRDWLTLPHRSEFFDFKQHPTYMKDRFSAGNKEAIDLLHNTTHNFVMFDRAYMGILSLLQKLEAKVSISFHRFN